MQSHLNTSPLEAPAGLPLSILEDWNNEECEQTAKQKAWEMNPRRGFDIGWEYAHLGVVLPAQVRPNEEGPMNEVRKGYEAGVAHFKRSNTFTSSDIRFVRKYLQIKLHAWMRGRMFSDDITPVYLKSITTRYCPITRQEMTVATGGLTDWSIDRLFNDAGYAPGALVVISTRANRAKGDLDYADVLKIVSLNKAYRGLSVEEWERMAAMMGLVYDRNNILPMLVVPPFGLTIVNRYARLQASIGLIPWLLTYKKTNIEYAIAALNAVVKGKKAKKAMDTFLRYAWGHVWHQIQCTMKEQKVNVALRCSTIISDMWHDPLMMEKFRRWIESMPDGAEMVCWNALCRWMPELSNWETTVKDWGVESRGYVE